MPHVWPVVPPARRIRLLASPADPPLSGQRNAFPLAFTDQGPRGLRERAHHGEHQVRQGRVLPGEDDVFLQGLDTGTAAAQFLRHSAQISGVASQPGPRSARPRYPRRERTSAVAPAGPFRVLDRDIVREHPARPNVQPLPLRVLIQAAHPERRRLLTFRAVVF